MHLPEVFVKKTSVMVKRSVARRQPDRLINENFEKPASSAGFFIMGV